MVKLEELLLEICYWRIERHSAHAVIIASGGYGNVYFLSTNAMGSNVTAGWKIHKQGALFANPCFVQIHPTCIPVHGTNQSKLTLMSESLEIQDEFGFQRKKKMLKPFVLEN
jgi:succinate dehydrogenase / fumarate reductase flavoprotein subunit